MILTHWRIKRAPDGYVAEMWQSGMDGLGNIVERSTGSVMTANTIPAIEARLRFLGVMPCSLKPPDDVIGVWW